MKSYSIVLTTLANEGQAKPIIETLLKEKLAACIQVLNINSHYLWKDSIEHDKEVLLLIKTKAALFSKLKNKLEALHPYETPEIIQLPIISGNSDYLNWIGNVTTD